MPTDDNATPEPGAVDEGTPPSTPDTPNPDDTSTPDPPDGVQRRIDEITKARREAEREAAYWRGVAESQTRQTQPTPPDAPKELDPEDFESESAYLRAVAKQTQDTIRQQAEAERRQREEAERQQQIATLVSSARKAHPDWDEVVRNPSLPITQEMMEASMGDKMGEILYHLGKNPSEAARIARMSPLQQAREIGRIESRIGIKTTTNAPNPPPRIAGRSTPPRKTEAEMSRSELHAKWMEDRKKALGVR